MTFVLTRNDICITTNTVSGRFWIGALVICVKFLFKSCSFQSHSLKSFCRRRGAALRGAYSHSTGSDRSAAQTRPASEAAKEKNSEWVAYEDPASQCIFYTNVRTGESRWEEPDEFAEAQAAQVAAGKSPARANETPEERRALLDD